MNKKYAIIMLLFLVVTFTAGCVGQPSPSSDIKSNEDVSRAVTNISQDVEDVSSILSDLDKKLG